MENTVQSIRLSPSERQYAAAYLEGSRALLLSRVRGLPPEAMRFRPAPSAWSIADCIEHCSVAEAFGWQWLQATLREPVPAGGHPEESLRDPEWIIALMTDRSRRVKTLPMLEPCGQFPDVDAALLHFTRHRQSFISFVLQTDHGLRDRCVTHPVTGRIDLYQLLILQSAHLQRHVLQIEALKAHPDMPRPPRATATYPNDVSLGI